MKNKVLLTLLIGLVCLKIYAQDIQNIKLNDWMCDNLHSVLVDISKKHQVNFEYDIERIQKIDYCNHPTNKPLSIFLEQLCKANKLKYYISAEDNVVHIVEKWFMPNQTIATETQKFTGNPTRYDFSISGKIIDKETREALPFVSILAKGTTIGTTSNVDGYFTLFKMPSDTSTLLLSYIGYQRKEIFFTPDVKAKGLFIEMIPRATGLEEVVVTAERQDLMQINGEQTSLIKMSPKKLSTLPNLGEKDILRSFQLMPGISAANENSSGLYVRGGTPDQVLVLYDGFTVYNVEHMFGFFSAFNSNAIKDVQLYKSGFDAKYGGRLSSVLEITGKEGNQKEFNAAADVSLMSVNGFVEFPIGSKTTVIMAGRRSWKSPVYSKIFDQYTEEEDVLNNSSVGRPGGSGATTDQETKSYFYDFNSKITFKPTDKDIIAFSFYNGKDDLDNSVVPSTTGTSRHGGDFSMNMETTDLTKWGNTGLSLKWSKQYNKRLYINSLLSYSNYYSYRERSTSGSFTRGENTSSISRSLKEDNNLVDLSGKIDFEYKLSQNQQLGFGLQATHNKIDYSYLQNDTITVINRDNEGQTYSAYVEDKLSLFGSKLAITPGLRYNYFTGTSKTYFEPRLNIMYKLTDKIRLKGATGQYCQFANRVIREDITEGSRDFWVLSDNDKLPVSSSVQFVGGASYETSKYVFDVEGFYKKLDNVTEYSLRVETSKNGIDYNENFYTGTGLAKGIDFLAQKKYGKINGWIGYTLSQVTNNISEFGDCDFYASHDVTHEFKFVLMYKWRKWDFGATWIYATGKPYTAPEGGYELTLLDGTTVDYINVSIKNGKRLPDYHRFDLSATLNFKIAGTAPASIGFSLFNAYNRANVWYKEYEIIDNEVIETPVYYLGITPNITFSVKLK
jgi:ferric enterobactin receptor